MAEPTEILLQQLPEIEKIIEWICRRKGMDADAIDEFGAEVKLCLVSRDYLIIRKYEGRSPFLVYLTAVIRHLLLDYQRSRWGKWRESSDARHLGPIAVEVERLLHRDHRSIDDVVVSLRAKHPDLTKEDVQRIAEQLPVRIRHREVDLEKAASVAAPQSLVDPIRAETAARISTAVKALLRKLPEEDRLIFALRFESEWTVAQIARALDVGQPTLYRRLYKHFDQMRDELLRAGVSRHDAEDLIGVDTPLLDFGLKSHTSRPSDKQESAVAARQEKT